jgi:HD-GYP domain-containing protein (c-di-GMP phosphodiesterase class II)
MPAHRFLNPAFPGYESVPARLLAGISMLPCDLYVWRGPRPALYAMRGGDPSKVIARAERGLPFLIRETDADPLRGALTASLPKVLGDQRISPIERSKTAYLIAAKVLAPLFVGEDFPDRDGFATAHRAMESFAVGLLEDEEMIWAMVATMLRHAATHTHSINTAVYGIALARSIPLGSREAIRGVALGGLIHDIGMSRLPRAVLDKPGPLNALEWQLVHGHASAGYDMIVRAMGHPPSYGHIVAEHHERWDGSGYPAGRSGSSVALDSQLVGIVDAFDALTTKRSFRPALSASDALQLMRLGMKGQFNDELVCEFADLLGGWRALSHDLKGADLAKLLKKAG